MLAAGVEQVTGDRGAPHPLGGRSLARLRRRCQAKLEALGLQLPVPFTIEGFCAVLGERLGVRIVLVPVDTSTGPCGLWVATDTTRYFFYEQTTSQLHQEQIIGHEAGHLVFDHDGADVRDGAELAGLLGLDVTVIRRMLGRTSYTTEEEQEAEVFGTLLLERAVHATRAAPPPMDPDAAAVIGRVQAALTGSTDPPGL
jgi:hypothetical protein